MSNVLVPKKCCNKCENKGPTVAINYNINKNKCICLASVEGPLDIEIDSDTPFSHQVCSEAGQTTGGTTGGTSGGTDGTTTGWGDWFGPGKIMNLNK